MKKTLIGMIGLMAITLSSCSGGLSLADPIIGRAGSTGSVTITEKRDNTTGQLTRSTAFVPAVFTFRATRGSLGGIINGYKITSMKIGGNTLDLIDPKKPIVTSSLNVFVQSGFSCTPAPSSGQNCSTINKDPANGSESAPINITDGSLESYMLNNGGSANVTYNLVFTGVDDTGHTFEIPVPGFTFIGSYAPVK